VAIALFGFAINQPWRSNAGLIGPPGEDYSRTFATGSANLGFNDDTDASRWYYRFRHADNNVVNSVHVDGHVAGYEDGTVALKNVYLESP
jgi:hypothetical protein